MSDNPERSIIPRQQHELTVPLIGRNRILGEMIEESLALGREEAVAKSTKFRIGDYMWCEPEYQQIFLWASALKVEASRVVDFLVAGKNSELAPTRFQEGQILALAWNRAWRPNLALSRLCLPNLTELSCTGNELTELDISGLPSLSKLYCKMNHLAKLDLTAAANLTVPHCDWNQFTDLPLPCPKLMELVCVSTGLIKLDLSNVPNLTKLVCDVNKLTALSLAQVPRLNLLSCCFNQLTELDLSCVPNLTNLSCQGTHLAEIDIRPIRELVTLKYDSETTRLIQRPDQNF